jgi:hypothetical protein
MKDHRPVPRLSADDVAHRREQLLAALVALEGFLNDCEDGTIDLRTIRRGAIDALVLLAGVKGQTRELLDLLAVAVRE